MSRERLENTAHEIFIFIGENRSNRAIEMDQTWESCQKNRKPVLCAIQLFDAISFAGLDPYRQIFLNLWTDDGTPDPAAPVKLRKMMKEGLEIIGMGEAVQKELEKLGIPHRKMVHPAARGIWRRLDVYRPHVKKILLGSQE